MVLIKEEEQEKLELDTLYLNPEQNGSSMKCSEPGFKLREFTVETLNL